MNTLHAAFFDVETYRQETMDLDPIEREKQKEMEEVKQETSQKLDNLADEIGRPKFSKVAESIVKDKKNTESFKENKERFDKRLQSENSQ